MEEKEMTPDTQTEEAAQDAPTEENTPEPQAEQEESETKSPEEKRAQLFTDVMEIVETMLVSVFVVLLVFTYLARPVTVEGRSMVPTLNDQDKLVMLRMLYTPKQGDIVVVDNHRGNVFDAEGNVVASGRSLNENIIKRVIAVAGQTVNVDERAGEVYVDGEALHENYINERTLTNDGAFIYPITIPEGYVFVMGDNRNKSTDSRSSCVGLVSEEDVLGNAYFRYYPITDIGFVD